MPKDFGVTDRSCVISGAAAQTPVMLTLSYAESARFTHANMRILMTSIGQAASSALAIPTRCAQRLRLALVGNVVGVVEHEASALGIGDWAKGYHYPSLVCCPEEST